jgi:DNA-binding response OmpR family regulator
MYNEIDTLTMDHDPDKLSTIISNLLSNAIKFTPQGGKIIVHLNKITEGKDQYFYLKVKDNGLGIAKEAISQIFDRFFQVDDSSSRKGEGTGIGLALTKELITLMHGTITLKSELGKGSEFMIKIPVSTHGAMVEDVPLHYFPQHTSVLKNSQEIIGPQLFDDDTLPLVLIIEDNPDVAIYLQICLLDKYRTLHAINGKEGVEIVLDKVPDVIICDVMMPEKDGFEVCTILKSDVRTDHVPIIILTAKATMKDRIAGLAHGADAYLEKPFVKAELFTRLDQLMLLREKMLNKLKDDGFSQILKTRAESPETKFLQNAIKIIHKDLNDSSFGARQLAYKLNLSESQLYRKLKAITGKSTAIFIRSIKLQKGKELILIGDKTISEVSYEVGFSDPSWFSRAFKAEFGFTPSDMDK